MLTCKTQTKQSKSFSDLTTTAAATGYDEATTTDGPTANGSATKPKRPNVKGVARMNIKYYQGFINVPLQHCVEEWTASNSL